jgi:hypothetical protein
MFPAARLRYAGFGYGPNHSCRGWWGQVAPDGPLDSSKWGL